MIHQTSTDYLLVEWLIGIDLQLIWVIHMFPRPLLQSWVDSKNSLIRIMSALCMHLGWFDWWSPNLDMYYWWRGECILSGSSHTSTICTLFISLHFGPHPLILHFFLLLNGLLWTCGLVVTWKFGGIVWPIIAQAITWPHKSKHRLRVFLEMSELGPHPFWGTCKSLSFFVSDFEECLTQV